MTFKITPHTLSLLIPSLTYTNSPFSAVFTPLTHLQTGVGLAHKLVISSPSCSWFLRLLPALKTRAALLCTPPTHHGCEGPGNACDNPHALSLQLAGEGLLLPNGDRNIETGQNRPGFCYITFQGRTICCLSGSL